jgi:hypothetical protein
VEEERPDDMVVLTPEKIILYAPRNAEPVHRELDSINPVEIGACWVLFVGLGLLLPVLDRLSRHLDHETHRHDTVFTEAIRRFKEKPGAALRRAQSSPLGRN